MGANAVQLFVRSEPFGPTSNPLFTWYLLDLYNADPIKLNLSVASITEPLKVASAFSRTFRIPNTANNADFFKTAFNINTEDFDPSRKIPAYINDSGETLITGSIRLNNVIRDLNRQIISYEIGFFGDTSDLASVIAGKYLRDLDLTMFNHNRNYASITNSWSSSGLFGGAIRYPLIEWGYTYDSTPAANIPTLSAYLPKSFTTSTNALQQNQLKPIISLKVLWDAIISPSYQMAFQPYTPQVGISGYTYSQDSFMGSTGPGAQLWNNLYVIVSKEASATLVSNQTFSSNVNGSIGFTIIAGGTTQIIAPIEIADPGNNYNTSTSRYKLPSSGDYVFQAALLKGKAYLNNSETNFSLYGRFRLKVTYPNGNVVYPATTGYIPIQPNSVIPDQTLNLQGGLAGSLVEMVIETIPAQLSGTYRATSFKFTEGAFKCNSAPQFINVQQLMPDNIKVTDFLKAVVDRFKLVFIPSTDNPKEFKIIPWIDWIRTGTAKDWTPKLDTSKEFKLTPLWENQTRNNIYRDAEDADFLNLNYFQATKQTYGQLNLDSGNELIVGETVRESLFAPTPLSSIAVGPTGGDWQKMLIPKIAKSTNDSAATKIEPIQPKLRLVFWNGLQQNIGATAAAYQWFLRNDVGTAVTQANYPLVSQFQNWPPVPSSLNLSWKYTAPLYNVAFGPTSNPTATTSLTQFTAYWQGWYDTVYDKYSKMVEATFNLDYLDVKDIKFNDYFWVNDSWYLVDSIKDYVVGETTNCKVKMYKIGDILGLSIPSGITALNPITACFGNSACAAFCCSGGVLGQRTIYTATPGAMVVNASFVYADTFGDIPANPGFYKVGGVVWQIGSGGGLIAITTPACICNGGGGSGFNTKYSATSLESVSCVSPLVPPASITIYGGQSSEFEENIDFYLDPELTIGATSGFYRYDDYVEDLGIVLNVYDGIYNFPTNITCTSCPSPSEYFAYTFGYGATADCDACCFVDGTGTYWSIDTTITPGSYLYLDYGITPAPAGIYSDGTFTYTIGGTGGEVTSSGDCSCSCTPLIDIDLEFRSIYTGFSGTLTLEKSFNGIDWLPVGVLVFPDSTPADTPVTTTFQVEQNAFTKAEAMYNGPSGNIALQYYFNGDLLVDLNAVLPIDAPIKEQSPDITQPDSLTREWKVNITP
jgi:hypothetical protein